MKLTLARSHRFDAPLAAVLGSLSSAEYASVLAAHHPLFDEVELLGLTSSDGALTRRVRYRARPFIARLGPFSPAPEWFAWIEHARLELASGVLTFENVPLLASVRARFLNRGVMRFRSDERGATVREARFEIGFQVGPLYRPLAELARSLVAGQLERALDDEARLLAGWLGAPRTRLSA